MLKIPPSGVGVLGKRNAQGSIVPWTRPDLQQRRCRISASEALQGYLHSDQVAPPDPGPVSGRGGQANIPLFHVSGVNQNAIRITVNSKGYRNSET